jgi:hypothetical protein
MKKEIMEKNFELAERRFEKPNGVSNNFFIWTMFVMGIIGICAAYFNL